MNRQEIMKTLYSEMADMISCLSVYNGSAEEKDSRPMNFEEFLEME